jgi:hypothetical protein
MSAVGKPVNPCQLVEGRDSLKGLVSGVQHALLLDVFRKIEFRPLNRRESIFDDTPKGFPSWFWAVKSTIEIPSSKI